MRILPDVEDFSSLSLVRNDILVYLAFNPNPASPFNTHLPSTISGI
jgi:hypothetical protein